jgi:squalene cyclase
MQFRTTNLSASAVLERGIEFLTSRQGKDGLWRDFLTPAGEASLWPTGYIAGSLRTTRSRACSDALHRAAKALIAQQDAAGGWGYNENVPPDADSTACALLFLAGVDCPETTRLRAMSCLQRHQNPNSGGIATYYDAGPIRRFMGVGRWMRFHGWCQPNTEVTAMAGRAAAAIESCPQEITLNAAWDFVRSRQREDGSWSSYWWASPHYATLQSVEFAVLMGGDDVVRRAGLWALRNQNADGAWNLPNGPNSAFATALSLSILRRAKVDQPSIERAVQALSTMLELDGGWPSDPILRIPLPGVLDPDKPLPWPFRNRQTGIIIADQHRTFTSATCIAAIADALSPGG